MKAVKVPANQFRIDVNTGTEVSPNWVEIKGLETLTFGGDVEEVDTSTFDTDGWGETSVVGRTRTVSGDGFYMVDEATGDLDPGQAKLDELSEEFGESAKGHFRWYNKKNGKGKEFYATVNLGDIGGGKKDMAKLSFELKVSGKPTNVTVTVS